VVLQMFLVAANHTHQGEQLIARDLVLAIADHKIAGTLVQQELLQSPVVLEILLFFATLGFVERRLGNVQVTAFHQWTHLPVEKGQQQSTDVGPVHVCVCHDDDSTVAQFF